MANYDEIGHRMGPQKKRTLYIADAKQATGQLITEIQIGQRMLGITSLEASSRAAPDMLRPKRPWRQRHANDSSRMMMDRNGTPPPTPPPTPHLMPNTIPPYQYRAKSGSWEHPVLRCALGEIDLTCDN